MIDIIGEFLWYSIIATPLIAYLIVRKMEFNKVLRILLGILITLFFAAMFAIISIGLAFRNGIPSPT